MRYDITMGDLNDWDVQKITKWVQNNPYGFTSHTASVGVGRDFYYQGTNITTIEIKGITDLKGFTAAMEGQ